MTSTRDAWIFSIISVLKMTSFNQISHTKLNNNENPEDQNEDENLDHEEHTEDENLDHEEHTEDDLAPRNETNLTPVTVFSQTQPSQNL